jgi:hypothetical protein
MYKKYSVPGGGVGGGKLVRITGGPEPHYIARVFVFLGSIRCNSVVTCRVDGTCCQHPFYVRRFLFYFLTFPLASPPLIWDPEKKNYRSPKPLSRRPWKFSWTSIFNIYITKERLVNSYYLYVSWNAAKREVMWEISVL